jgi:hypothetical protein
MSDDIDLRCPDAVSKNAEKGLDLRRRFKRGGTDVGVARARDLKNRVRLSPDTIGRMASYFARHEVDKRAPGFGSDDDPSAGYIAWLLWGGDEGRAWADKMKEKLAEAQGG